MFDDLFPILNNSILVIFFNSLFIQYLKCIFIIINSNTRNQFSFKLHMEYVTMLLCKIVIFIILTRRYEVFFFYFSRVFKHTKQNVKCLKLLRNWIMGWFDLRKNEWKIHRGKIFWWWDVIRNKIKKISSYLMKCIWEIE